MIKLWLLLQILVSRSLRQFIFSVHSICNINCNFMTIVSTVCKSDIVHCCNTDDIVTGIEKGK